jgi:uncharacterized protein YxjI
LPADQHVHAVVGSKARATFVHPKTGWTENLVMKGNWMDTKADVVDESSGRIVCQINRKLPNMRELFFAKQTYAVTVAPGVDMSLMAALCICLDEKHNENGGG